MLLSSLIKLCPCIFIVFPIRRTTRIPTARRREWRTLHPCHQRQGCCFQAPSTPCLAALPAHLRKTHTRTNHLRAKPELQLALALHQSRWMRPLRTIEPATTLHQRCGMRVQLDCRRVRVEQTTHFSRDQRHIRCRFCIAGISTKPSECNGLPVQRVRRRVPHCRRLPRDRA